ncbi:MAG: hypothetical protein IPP22_03380 [Nitrosomonas sp.]|nr:hypothetical protein [Nitrosomonas sp.]
MERNQIRAEFLFASVISVACVIAIFDAMELAKSLEEYYGKNSYLSILIHSFFGSGTFFIVFKTIISVYFKFIWKYFHHRTYLDGEWEYSYSTKYNSKKRIWDDEEVDREGTARIVHTPEDICIYGTSI